MYWEHEDAEKQLPVIVNTLLQRIQHNGPDAPKKLLDLLGGMQEGAAAAAEANVPLPPPLSVRAVCSRRQTRAHKRMVLRHSIMPNIQQLRLALANNVAFVFAFQVEGPELEAMAPAGSLQVGLAIGYDDDNGVFMVWTDWNDHARSTIFGMPYDAVCGSGGADRAADFLAVLHNNNEDPEMIKALSLFDE